MAAGTPVATGLATSAFREILLAESPADAIGGVAQGQVTSWGLRRP